MLSLAASASKKEGREEGGWVGRSICSRARFDATTTEIGGFFSWAHLNRGTIPNRGKKEKNIIFKLLYQPVRFDLRLATVVCFIYDIAFNIFIFEFPQVTVKVVKRKMGFTTTFSSGKSKLVTTNFKLYQYNTFELTVKNCIYKKYHHNCMYT